MLYSWTIVTIESFKVWPEIQSTQILANTIYVTISLEFDYTQIKTYYINFYGNKN